MNKTFVSKQVKLEILNICSGPVSQLENLTENIELALLGYDDYETWCRQLEGRLQYIAQQYHTGKEICPGNVTANTTVNQCIQMVI